MDPMERITAKDALDHHYFDSLKPDPNVFKEERNIQIHREIKDIHSSDESDNEYNDQKAE